LLGKFIKADERGDFDAGVRHFLHDVPPQAQFVPPHVEDRQCIGGVREREWADDGVQIARFVPEI